MKQKIHILRHHELDAASVSGKVSGLDHFSVFRIDFSSGEDFLKSVFSRDSFRSDFFSLVLVRSGEMITKVDFKTIHIRTHDLCMMTPSSIKQVMHISDDCRIEGVSFTAAFIKELRLNDMMIGVMEFFLSRYVTLDQLSRAEQRIFSRQVRILEQKVALRYSHSYGREILASSFLVFLYEMAEIGKAHDMPGGPVFGRKEELVIKFSRLAIRHHIDERRLDFYSRQLFVTTKYLSETVKEITGKTAGELLDELQVQEAKRLLEETDMGIAEIAYRLQFSNPAFFSKFFTRIEGHSPRAHRAALNHPVPKQKP